MKKLLHIVATPRGSESRTLQISEVFLTAFAQKYPERKIEELNLFKEILPDITVKNVEGKYVLLGGGELSGKLRSAWNEIEYQIKRFMSADSYLISVPMWNFSVPYPLKHYIDIIMQPKYLFAYNSSGVEGLVKGKKMIVISSRGGDYGPNSQFGNFDLQEPYLRTIFGFVGIIDIQFINAQPMDAAGKETQRTKIEEAKDLAIKAAANF